MLFPLSCVLKNFLVKVQVLFLCHTPHRINIIFSADFPFGFLQYEI